MYDVHVRHEASGVNMYHRKCLQNGKRKIFKNYEAWLLGQKTLAWAIDKIKADTRLYRYRCKLTRLLN
jgi:hypothetical protein